MLIQADASFEVLQRKVFVGSVGLTIRKGEAEQQGLCAQHLPERLHDRDAASLPDESSGFLKGCFQGAAGCFAELRIRVHGIGRATVADFHFQPDGGRTVPGKMSLHFLQNIGGILIRH